MRRTIFAVSAANGAVALLSLARNILIARLISVEDFGLASTFAITVAMFEMASVGLVQLIVQARDGDSPGFLATIQTLQILRSVLGAAILIGLAWPIAALFGRPDMAWAYQALAVTPLLRGFRHLGIYHAQRQNRFGPLIATELPATLASVAAVWPAALLLGDFRVMLVALVVYDAVRVAASLAVARMPFRLAWRRDVIARAFGFGWPLLLNGLLMFWVFQGDRVIVGSLVGFEALGWFSAAFGLLLMPTTVIASTLQTLLMPRLSGLQDDRAGFDALALLVVQACLAISAAMAAGVALLGPAVYVLAYGASYAPGLPVFMLLAVAGAARLIKVAPTIIAMARGQTRLPLYGNLLRAGFVGVGAVAVWLWRDPRVLAGAAIAGEALSVMVMLWLCRGRLGLSLRPAGAALLAGAGTLIAATLYFVLAPPTLATAFGVDSGRVVLALSPLAMLLAAPELRRAGWRLLRGGT